MPSTNTSARISLSATASPLHSERVLTPGALAFLEALHLRFNERRLTLLAERQARQKRIDQGERPDFLAATATVRAAHWKVAPLPADLLDRRVEITGPVDRKMVINALNAGAKVFMADFEDSHTPDWHQTLDGQINLQDAIAGTISYQNPNTGKSYQLNQPTTTTLMVRPRGWHLNEKHLTCAGQPLSGSLVDFGLYFYHNAAQLMKQGSGPYFYLPKLESHLEARLWNEVFVFSQSYLDIPQGTIKATVLIETILAAFEMDEILYELRTHSAGLNCGRWDYIFSFIKKFRNRPGHLFPDRSQVNMTVPFMRAYCELLIQTCHRRGVHAMGGMAAQIPIKNDPEANAAALETVRQDKIREVTNGHDGTWVAHPGLVPVALAVFDAYLPGPNQIARGGSDTRIQAADLLAVPLGTITEAGLRENIRIGILYLESWLRGQGAAAIFNKMEDAATAEISRTQIWQWIHQGAQLSDGRSVDYARFQHLLHEELPLIITLVPANNRLDEAVQLFAELVKNPTYTEFLTLPAYELL